MATSNWTTAAQHDSDANFRIWGSELSTKLQAMSSTPGLVKTGDTGQINWTTVTRPAVNSDAGYEIYYLNDSLHATSPVYFKIWYGSASNVAYPRIRIQVGTGSDGAGTLTGTTSTASICNKSAATSATTYTSYLCVNTGFVGLAWKVAATFVGSFLICRSCDADGTPNGKAIFIGTRSTSTSNFAGQTVRLESVAAAQTQDATARCSLIPGGKTSSAVGADFEVYLCWMNAPDIRPIFGAGCVIVDDYPLGTTISVALVGTTARTYLSTGAGSSAPFPIPDAGGVTTSGLAMLWE